ncbi:putative prolyl 4-hydroxylase alpha subunit [Coniochaeta sp. 2T2.1]|nr:putative prolyl 4-hydroxylase alpha subunit [Coniochaeta sp. 2T2.1]
MASTKTAFTKSPNFSQVLYFLIAIAGALLGSFYISSLPRNCSIPSPEHQYQAQIFSRDPLIFYIRNFVSREEIAYLLRVAEDKYEPSKVYGGFDQSPVNTKMRDSESAFMDRADPVVRRVTKRAAAFQGWRGKTTAMEPLLVQRYGVDGFFNYHFDYDESMEQGNRATTFMSFLVANCTGGGTNFPFLPQPSDERWCDVIECDGEARDGFQGVIFKPVEGAAVFWENQHPNGSLHKGVYHAGLPVRTGVKVGLNIWSWDSAWVRVEEAV